MSSAGDTIVEARFLKRSRAGGAPSRENVHIHDDDGRVWVYACASDAEAEQTAQQFAACVEERTGREQHIHRIAPREYSVEDAPPSGGEGGR